MERKCDFSDVHKTTVVDAISLAVETSAPVTCALFSTTFPVPAVREISSYPIILTNVLNTDVDRSDSLRNIEVYIDFCVSTYNS